MKKDLLSIADLTQTEVHELLNTAIRLKAQRKPSQELFGKTLGMIFQKPSPRTAVSRGLAAAAVLMVVATFLSRVTGLIRAMVFSRVFGITPR